MAIKDMLGIDVIVDQKMAVVKDDLYKAIKEISELQYRLLEAETKLNNLQSEVKILHGGKV